MRLFCRLILIVAAVIVQTAFAIRVTGQVQTPRFISMLTNSNAYYEYLPQGYDPSDTLTYPVIVCIHGMADLGNGSASQLPLVLRSGVASIIDQHLFPNSFMVGGKTFRFIVIAPQFINPPTPQDINNVLTYIVQHYKVNPGRIYLTGLSMGGGTTWEYAGNNSTYANRVAAILPVSGLSSPTSARARIIAAANLPVWATHNDGDPQVPVSNTNGYISLINTPPAPVPAAIKTIFHSNIHDAWTQTYNPSFTMNGLNVYQWMLQYTRPVSSSNLPPVANAGTNQVVTLPAPTVTLSGSGTDADGTIASYAWTQVGGTPATITNPGSASTNITGQTTPGVRTFRLTVTDNRGSSGTDDVTITVNSSGVNQPPVDNAGTDQFITQPASSATLTGSATDSDGTVASHTWSFVNGPVTPTIATPGSYTTTVTGLTAPGSYTFRLTATDNNNATGTDDVVITITPVSGTRTINVNLYGSASYNDPAWNNWNIVSGLRSTTFKYSDGATSSISSVLSAQSGYSDNGPNYPVTMCPQQVGRDASYSNGVRRDTIKGLDNSKLYDIRLYASRGNAGQTTRFTVGGVNVDIATNTNYTNAAVFRDIAPVGQQIIITLTPLATYSYLNGFTLTEKTVTTQPPTPQLPVASAGPNQSITLPVFSVTLSGSGFEQGGQIVAYNWTQISGPNMATLATPSAATTLVSGLIQGVYAMRLTVTDSIGVSAYDTMTITVNPVVTQPPPGGLPVVTTPATIAIEGDTVALTASAASGLPIALISWTKFSVPGQTLKRLTVVGSSTSAGTGATVPDSAYVNRLKTYYKAQGIIDTIYNLSVGGSWVGDVDITTALNKGAPILLVNYPSNNYNASNNAAALAKFQEIKDSCDRRGVQFYCTGTQPRGVTNFDAAGRANLIVLNDSLRNRFGSRFIDFLTPMLDVTNNGIKAIYSYGDDIHVNNAGHERFFQIVRAANMFRNTISSASVVTSPSQAATVVRALAAGVHRFQVSVLDEGGFAASAVATVTVTAPVSQPNQAPKARAGADQTITLPVSSVALNGSASMDDYNITTYHWSLVSGAGGVFSSPDAVTTNLSGLGQGVYAVELEVMDDSSASGRDTLIITVNAMPPPLPNQAPVATAGPTQTVTLPVASANLTGGGSDADGTIAGYAWVQLSGPNTAAISSPSSANTEVSGFIQGTYHFGLTVTDDEGATNTAATTVIVNPAPVIQTRVINVNLYGTASYNNAAWNNWNTVSSLTSPILKYSDGTSSTITSVISAQNGYSDNGTNYPVTMCPQQVGRDASYGTSARTNTLNGLDNSKMYDIQLYATRGNAGQTTRFTINGVNVDIATNSNFTNVARFTNISPANGRIVITLTNLSNYNYLNGFTLTEKTATQSQAAGAQMTTISSLSLAAAPPDATTVQPLNVFPNPARDQFTIQVNTPQTGDMKIQVINSSGKIVRQIESSKTQASIRVDIPAGGLGSGTYIIRVIIGNRSLSTQVIKL